ncbi:DUF2510 domain-containing protein [Agrococcus sp. Ld7]|uniref:DUF2510 domain-containing protein n=1 Tax=Agrococcus sp. Ld7 TaxID=649148 RepID=UPI0038669DC1
MPSFLIIHSALHDGDLSAYRQPPTLDISGMRASLDWGDITLHVPAGDLPITVYVTRSNGQVEGATITVRAPAGTGTRLTFVPPVQPGGRSLLRIDGQWPADATMHYYAARDARALQQPTQPMPWKGPGQSSQPRHPQQSQAPEQPQGQRESQPAEGVRVVSPVLGRLDSPTPPIGPTPGSTGAVPLQPSSFGHEQGARVDPIRASAPTSRSGGQPPPAPSFGQRSERAEHDGRIRERAGGDQPPSIPTPAEFHRLEQQAAEAQRRVYDAWQAQQRPPGALQPSDAPLPVGLPASPGQPQANWYPDPFRRADVRWFDGRQWTASIMRGGVRGTDQPG